MAKEDAERWNARYVEDKRYATFEHPRPFLVDNAGYLPGSGLAIDVAMGLGGNAGFLLAHGLRVVGVDISRVALQRARARLPALMAVLADLNTFYFPPKTFDVILNFFYLQRDLWPAYERALRPGGILFIETLTQEMQASHPEIDPRYLLASGELRHAFPSLETIIYQEGWSESESGFPRPVARIMAQKPKSR